MAKTGKSKKAEPKKKAPQKSAPKKSAASTRPAPSKPAKGPAIKVELVREQLVEELARLKKRLGVIHDDDETSDNSDVGDIADVAASHETREILRELQSTEEEQLKLVQAALVRIDNGTYGKCQRCGNAIEPARLEALPHAPTCIACKRKEERGEYSR